MSIGLVGRKSGMTRVFTEDGTSIPVTVVEVQPNRVTQIKTSETDGYSAVQVAFGDRRANRINKAQAGHFAKAGVAPARHLVEIKVDDPAEYTVGQEIKVEELFEVGAKADVAGVSKGKGFAGVMKRHNFKGQSASHGVHKTHRAPGSIGACATPARVFKGMKMAGRMGGEKVTTLNLELAGVDVERGLLLLNGAVPGPKGSVVLVREAVKARG